MGLRAQASEEQETGDARLCNRSLCAIHEWVMVTWERCNTKTGRKQHKDDNESLANSRHDCDVRHTHTHTKFNETQLLCHDNKLQLVYIHDEIRSRHYDRKFPIYLSIIYFLLFNLEFKK